MLINGEKFACEACVRGHRVSSCHHQDRPLVHVNKKGRPVSQCHHCRGLRKARSQHVKCECHDKAHSKEDCPHEKADGKAESNTCCCAHGSRCTCSLKKEHLDPVLEDIPQLIQPKEPARPRVSNMNSHESKATVFTNGHHKPVHKFNDAHNHCGAPYKVPSRSHTIHGHRDIAQRSTDSLPLTKTSKPLHESPLHNSITTSSDVMRMAKSEHNSPLLGPTSAPKMDLLTEFNLGTYDPNAYAYSPFRSESQSTAQNSQQELILPERFPDSWFMTYEQAHDYEPPVPSAGMNDAHPIDWSAFSSDLNTNFYDANMGGNGFLPNQQPSIPAFDQFNQLRNSGLASSSGEISETEDMGQLSRPANSRTLSGDVSNDLSSTGGDDTPEKYRHSSASSYYGTPQANMLASDNLGNLDLDEYMQQNEEQTRNMQLQSQQQQHQIQMQQQRQQQQQQQQPAIQTPSPPQLSRGSPGFSTPNSNGMLEHPYTIHEAQQYAHMNDSLQRQMQLQKSAAMPTSSMAEDPMLSTAPDMSNPTLSLDDEQEDEDWVR